MWAIIGNNTIVAGPGLHVRAAKSGERRVPVREVKPVVNAITEHHVSDHYEIESDAVVHYFGVQQLLLQQAQLGAIKQLAALRFEHEVGGITLGGMPVNTALSDQARLTSAYQSLSSGLITQTLWKAPSGFVTLTLAELEPIARAVAVHVSACFGAEAMTNTLIMSRDLPALETSNIFNDFLGFYNTILAGE